MFYLNKNFLKEKALEREITRDILLENLNFLLCYIIQKSLTHKMSHIKDSRSAFEFNECSKKV
jgi:hypothetical protein